MFTKQKKHIKHLKKRNVQGLTEKSLSRTVNQPHALKWMCYSSVEYTKPTQYDSVLSGYSRGWMQHKDACVPKKERIPMFVLPICTYICALVFQNYDNGSKDVKFLTLDVTVNPSESPLCFAHLCTRTSFCCADSLRSSCNSEVA